MDLEEVWCGDIWVQWQAGFCEPWSFIKHGISLVASQEGLCFMELVVTFTRCSKMNYKH
jgi:hypothetical protein